MAILFATCPACGSDDTKAVDPGDEDEDVPSGAVCPATSTLTYENFGKAFMEKSCTACHSSALVGEVARQDAPADHNFDTLAGILEAKEHIDIEAAAGPSVVNEHMPPAGAKHLDDTAIPVPSTEERKQLGEWLACGAK